jgi:hypothetical protein
MYCFAKSIIPEIIFKLSVDIGVYELFHFVSSKKEYLLQKSLTICKVKKYIDKRSKISD